MARIPIADREFTLGDQAAAPQRAVLPTARDFGAGTGQVIEQAGAIGMQITERQQAQQYAEERQMAAEEMRRKREANRIKAATASARVQNDLDSLNDEIAKGLADGSIDKTAATDLWKKRSAELMKGGLADVDEENRPELEAALADNVNRAGRVVTKMVAQRDRVDLEQGTNSYIEEMQRYAARGSAQADQAIANVEKFVGAVGGMAGIDAQKTVQRFREQVRFRQASDLVMTNPAEALKVLRDKDSFPELDPDKRAALVAHADATLLRQQERARIEAERIAREQDRVFSAAASVFESGRTFSAEYGEQVLARLKGSPYESAVREMIKIGPQNVAAATLPIEQQRAQLDALVAKANAEGSSPALNKEIERRQKVLSAAERDAKDDPLSAANERGIVPALRPINVLDIGGLQQQLADRVSAAKTASAWAGKPVSPLRPEEAEQLSTALGQLPPDQKASALATLSTIIQDRSQITALARQLDAKDRVLADALMMADTKTSKGRYVSEIMLRGQQALKDGRIKEDKTRETGWRAEIANQIGEAYPNAELRERMISASYSVLLGLAAEGDADIPRAIRMATGGIRSQADDSKVPLPYGWSERDMSRALRSYPENLLPAEMRAGQTTLTREQVREKLDDAILMYAGQGKYVIRAGNGFITDANGKRVVIDLYQGPQ